MLHRIAEGWMKRAKVRREPVELDFDPTQADFLEKLLPFCEHPRFQSLSPNDRQKILSCGWLIYNEKTVAIETAIVTPSCNDALAGQIPGLGGDTFRHIICETLVDEAYHLLLVENANRLTRFHRDLGHIRVPTFNLVRFMEMEQAGYSEPWQRILIQLATSVVSEIFVSDYLHQLSDCQDIQPMNRATVAAHRHDELAHSKIFTLLAEAFYPALSPVEKAFFAEILPKPIAWFADMELDVWESVLQQLQIPGAASIIADCRPLNANAALRVDYSGVTELARNLGVLDTACGQDGFLALGIAA
ncbi:diiron oxygenase [Sphingobium sp. CFD-1]|nr:diiron oxygenase [Sphingobium sp. CFD-1]